MAPRLTVEQRRLARRLSAEGWSLREIGRQVGCTHEAVRLVVAEKQKLVKPYDWAPAVGRMGMAEREEISLALRRYQTTCIYRAKTRLASASDDQLVLSNSPKSITSNRLRRRYGIPLPGVDSCG